MCRTGYYASFNYMRLIMLKYKVKFVSGLCLSAVILFGCANPSVVDVKQLQDNEMSCVELKRTIEDMDQLQVSAKKHGGLSAENTLAALVFWPGIIVNELNVNKAVDAVIQRKLYLTEIYLNKCSKGKQVENTVKAENVQKKTSQKDDTAATKAKEDLPLAKESPELNAEVKSADKPMQPAKKEST